MRTPYLKSYIVVLLISMLFISAFACIANAQGSGGGQLLVKTTDKNQNQVWGANITVLNVTSSTQQTMTANNSGMVLFTNLRPGYYNVTAEKGVHTAFPTYVYVSGSGVQNVSIDFPGYSVGPVPATATPQASSIPSGTPAPSATKTPGFAFGLAAIALALAAMTIMNKKE